MTSKTDITTALAFDAAEGALPPAPPAEIPRSVLNRMFLRSLTLEVSYNYERQQALGFAYTMIPALKKIYHTDVDRAAALKRHLEFFNTTSFVAPFIAGVSASVEVEQKNDESMDPETVNGIKASLMGPLAGIGDSLYWGTIRLLVTGIGTSLAMAGNILGPIIFFLGFNIPVQLLAYWYIRSGYKFGTNYLTRLAKSGGMEKLTYGAGILGLLVIGGMTASMVSVYVPLEFSVGTGKNSIQDIIDGIMPGLLSLGAFWGIYWLLGKRFKTTHILLIVFAVGLVAALFGILGVKG